MPKWKHFWAMIQKTLIGFLRFDSVTHLSIHLGSKDLSRLLQVLQLVQTSKFILKENFEVFDQITLVNLNLKAKRYFG